MDKTANAPESLGGNKDVSGAMVVNDFSLSGQAGFHFDEALLSTAASSDVVVASWNEP